MRKITFILLVLLAVSPFVSCGSKHPAIIMTEKFMDYVIKNDAKGAYSFFSARVKNKTPFGEYEQILTQMQPPKSGDGTAGQPWLVEGEKPTTTFLLNRFVEKNSNSYVYGTINEPINGQASFRIKVAENEGRWLVDVLMIELENIRLPGYYITEALTEQATQYFNWMMDGQADKMYERASKRVREKYPKDVFAVEAVGTTSGTIPREEGFSFDIYSAYANDDGKGYMAGGIVHFGKTMMDFELPFVFEDGLWKADFSKVTQK
jgi:hypothetical protein